MPEVDITGRVFGYLTAIKRCGEIKRPTWINPLWLFRCVCGTEKVILKSPVLRGKIRSCGCKRKELSSHKQVYKLPEGEASRHQLFLSYQRGASERGHVFTLTEEQFGDLTKRSCDYCGVEPHSINRIARLNGHYTYNGIDRVDNKKGYTAENVVPCCVDCNRAKHKRSREDFLTWLNRAAEHLKQKEIK